MKPSFFVFFSIFLSLYSLINFYIGCRAWRVFPFKKIVGRKGFILLFGFVALAFFLGRFLAERSPSWISTAFLGVGVFWLGAMVHLFLLILLVDALRILNHFFPFFPAGMVSHRETVKNVTAGVIFFVVMTTQIFGFFHARHTKIIHLNQDTTQQNPSSLNLPPITLVFVSDIHLGSIGRKDSLRKMVDEVNNLKPDVLVLGGDIFDGRTKEVDTERWGNLLESLHAPLGVFAVVGNHEYYAGVDQSIALLQQHGVTVLRDQSVTVENRFTLVGADDKSLKWDSGETPKPFKDLLLNSDKNLPIVLVCHNPDRVQEAVAVGVDLFLAGHTHQGQIWPIGLINELIYDVSHGHRLFGPTTVYVSSGYGTWGPPVRVGTNSEIVKIRGRFLKN